MITLAGLGLFLFGWIVGVLSLVLFIVVRGISIIQGGR